MHVDEWKRDKRGQDEQEQDERERHERERDERCTIFGPRRRALDTYTNESHGTARVERELKRGCDRKEHVYVSNYGEKS